MASLQKCHRILTNILKSQQLCVVPVATYLECKLPPVYENIEYPERRRMKVYQKGIVGIYNRPLKMRRDLEHLRGPEKVSNKLMYGQYGVQALQGGLLKNQHLEDIRLFLIKKLNEDRMFAIWRIEQPWKTFTKKGTGVRMGSWKGAVDHYTYPVKANRIILEVGGHVQYEEIKDALEHLARSLPFKARAVSLEIMKESEKREKDIEEQNLNPFSFKYCARKNFFGIKKELSPYDFIWHGKYR